MDEDLAFAQRIAETKQIHRIDSFFSMHETMGQLDVQVRDEVLSCIQRLESFEDETILLPADDVPEVACLVARGSLALFEGDGRDTPVAVIEADSFYGVRDAIHRIAPERDRHRASRDHGGVLRRGSACRSSASAARSTWSPCSSGSVERSVEAAAQPIAARARRYESEVSPEWLRYERGDELPEEQPAGTAVRRATPAGGRRAPTPGAGTRSGEPQARDRGPVGRGRNDAHAACRGGSGARALPRALRRSSLRRRRARPDDERDARASLSRDELQGPGRVPGHRGSERLFAGPALRRRRRVRSRPVAVVRRPVAGRGRAVLPSAPCRRRRHRRSGRRRSPRARRPGSRAMPRRSARSSAGARTALRRAAPSTPRATAASRQSSPCCPICPSTRASASSRRPRTYRAYVRYSNGDGRAPERRQGRRARRRGEGRGRRGQEGDPRAWSRRRPQDFLLIKTRADPVPRRRRVRGRRDRGAEELARCSCRASSDAWGSVARSSSSRSWRRGSKGPIAAARDHALLQRRARLARTVRRPLRALAAGRAGRGRRPGHVAGLPAGRPRRAPREGPARLRAPAPVLSSTTRRPPSRTRRSSGRKRTPPSSPSRASCSRSRIWTARGRRRSPSTSRRSPSIRGTPSRRYRPLGNIMRARNHAYRLSTQERKAAKEPDGTERFD